MKVFIKESKINVYNDRHVSLTGEVTNHVVLEMDNKKVTFKENSPEAYIIYLIEGHAGLMKPWICLEQDYSPNKVFSLLKWLIKNAKEDSKEKEKELSWQERIKRVLNSI